MIKSLKANALFISMLTGIIFYPFISYLAPITPWFLFIMLLITYCRISPSQIRPAPLHLWLGCVQLVGSLSIYFILKPFNADLAEGCMLCILVPTATSAPVFASLLGGSIACLASYTIISNLAIAFIAPFIFSVLGTLGLISLTNGDLSLGQTFWAICIKVMPLLLGPFILSVLFKRAIPKLHSHLRDKQIYSFWLWVVALAIVMASTTSKVVGMIEADKTIYLQVIYVALGSAAVCVLQFFTGWSIGNRFYNKIAGGQGLGQKNTILAIWLANTFFSPLVAIAPASYVLWQNLMNSYQLWEHQKKQNTGK